MTNEDAPFQVNESYAQFQVPGHQYSVIRFPLTVDWVPFAVDVAKALAAALDEAFPQAEPTPAPTQQNGTAPPQRPQQAPRGRKPADDLRAVAEQCEQCHAGAFEKAAFFNKKTNKQVSARIVCTSCKDGQYDHLVRWVNDDEPAPEYVELDAQPF